MRRFFTTAILTVMLNVVQLLTPAVAQSIQPIPNDAASVVYLDEMQQPEVLDFDASGRLADLTPFTDRVVYAKEDERKRVVVVWFYAYHRIPITRASEPPTFQSRDLEAAQLPVVSNVKRIVDPATGKWIGLAFDVIAEVKDSWQCNIQVECTYYNAVMGRAYTHRRVAHFTYSTQPDIADCLERIAP